MSLKRCSENELLYFRHMLEKKIGTAIFQYFLTAPIYEKKFFFLTSVGSFLSFFSYVLYILCFHIPLLYVYIYITRYTLILKRLEFTSSLIYASSIIYLIHV